MRKQRIRLTEGDLYKVIKESVKKIVKENNTEWLEDPDMPDYSSRKSYRNKVARNSVKNNSPMPTNKEMQIGYAWDLFDKQYDRNWADVDCADDVDRDYGNENRFDEPIHGRDLGRREWWQNRGENGRYEKGYKNESLNRIVKESINRVLRGR